MDQNPILSINVAHDTETGVFYVHHSDVPGLSAEDATLDGLVAVLRDLVPLLLEAGGSTNLNGPVTFRLEADFEAAPLHAA